MIPVSKATHETPFFEGIRVMTPDAPTLTGVVRAILPRALRLLESWVRVNSFTANPEGVNRLAQLTCDAFAPLGFHAERIPSSNPGWGDHLVMSRAGTSKKSLLLVSHLDTVYPPEEEIRNDFHWQREGNRLFGPGTIDIKGGSVVMWMTLQALKELRPDVFCSTTWKLLWNSSEENLPKDFAGICRSRIDSGTLAALVFEAEGRMGSRSLLVTRRKGRLRWKIKVQGRGAHAGNQHPQGANAIAQVSRLVDQITELTDASRGLTFNVGLVSGGTAVNRVPHEAVAEGEFRAFDTQTYRQARLALLALAGTGGVRSEADDFPCKVDVEILHETGPWMESSDTDRLFGIWNSTATELGIELGSETRGGLSDGNYLWDALPTLDGLGPWGANAHSSERSADGTKMPEYAELDSFVPKAMLNTLAILKLLNQ